MRNVSRMHIQPRVDWFRRIRARGFGVGKRCTARVTAHVVSCIAGPPVARVVTEEKESILVLAAVWAANWAQVTLLPELLSFAAVGRRPVHARVGVQRKLARGCEREADSARGEEGATTRDGRALRRSRGGSQTAR